MVGWLGWSMDIYMIYEYVHLDHKYLSTRATRSASVSAAVVAEGVEGAEQARPRDRRAARAWRAVLPRGESAWERA